MGFITIALDGILDPVEEECNPQEFEQLSFNRGRYIGLEVEKIEIWLVIDFFAWRMWHFIQMLDNV